MERLDHTERLRLFVAIDVPRDLLAEVADAVAGLKQRWPSARWAPIENQHVTLKFLGSVESDRLETLTERVRKVASERTPAEVGLGPLGTFPGGRRMRVLWVGLDDPAGLLTGSAADLDRALEPLGFEPENRSFTPHLTLARFRTPERLDTRLDAPGMPIDRFEVPDLVLYRSRLSPKGATYEALERFPLGGEGTYV